MKALRQWMEEPPPSARDRSSIRVPLAGAALLAFLVLALLLRIWDRGEETRAIRTLAPRDRTALYHRTLDDLRSACGPSTSVDLSAHCERQARFILQFRECDADCRRRARALLPAPTR
jgi:hypothetical protein